MKPLKPGTLIPVARQDGVPICPHCGQLTVEVEAGLWQCPFQPLIVADDRAIS